jgi:hypothetical protein
VLVPDAFQRGVTDGQIELADQAARAEGGQRFAKFDKLRFGGRTDDDVRESVLPGRKDRAAQSGAPTYGP